MNHDLFVVLALMAIALLVAYINVRISRGERDGSWHWHSPGTIRRWTQDAWEYRAPTADEAEWDQMREW